MASTSPPDLCVIRGCAEPAQRVGGFCVAHSQSFRRSSSLALPSDFQLDGLAEATVNTCVVAACTQPTVLFGYCAAHVRVHTGMDASTICSLTSKLLKGTTRTTGGAECNAVAAPSPIFLSDLLDSAVAAKRQSDVLLHIQQDIYRESSSDRVVTKIFDAVNQLILCDRITCFIVDSVRQEFVGHVASSSTVTAEALRMVRLRGCVPLSNGPD